MKKILVSLLVILNLFGITAFASEKNIPNIDLNEEFFTTENKAKRLCEILNTNEESLNKYCNENNIVFLAANADISKQIKLICFEDDFSKATKDLSLIKEDELIEILPSIVGFAGKVSESSIVSASGQRFIKTEFYDTDTSGSFTFTQYYTVENGKSYTLVFLTSENADLSYVDSVFDAYSKDSFFKEKEIDTEKYDGKINFTLVAIIVLSVAGVVVLITVIKDSVKGKKTEKE